MRYLILISLIFFSCAQQIPNKDQQIAEAVLAAPEKMRADATVLGYDANNNVVELRKGTNEMICLADNPKQNGFSVAAYHKDMEPFMARGRELKAQGKGFKEIFETFFRQLRIIY